MADLKRANSPQDESAVAAPAQSLPRVRVSNGRTIWIADAHRNDGKRFVVRADEKLSALLELESVIGA